MSTSDEEFDIKKELGKLAQPARKLTEWANEPTVSALKEDIEAVKPTQQLLVQKITKWNNLRDIEGDAKPAKVMGRSAVQPKLIRRQAEWKYPALSEPFLSTREMFKISPTTFEDTLAAEQNQIVLNYQFRTQINRVNFIDNFVRACVDEGTVCVQVGWERVTKKVTELVPTYDFYAIESQQQLEEFKYAIDLYENNPSEFSKLPKEIVEAVNYFLETDGLDTPVYAVLTGETEVEVEKVVCNKPTLMVRDLANMYIDPSCNGDFSKAMFAAHTFETCKAELLKNPERYKNIDAIDWESLPQITDPDHKTSTPQDFQFKDAARKRVLAYEYWGYYDIEGKGELTPIVATWIGDVMVRLEKNPFPDQKIPFVFANYMPVKRELFGESDAELIEDNQRITGAVTRGMIDLLARSANSQQGIPKGLLDPANEDRFNKGENYQYNPPSGNPEQVIIHHKYPEIPNSALLMTQMQSNDAESLTGTKAFGEGLSGSAYGDVAAGIKGMLTAQALRDMNILRRLANAIKEIGEKICQMNAVWLSDKEIVRITNERDNKISFIEVNREDLVGSFDIEVSVSTTEVDNVQASDLAFMLQTLGPEMDEEMRNLILSEIARLKKQPELANRLRNFKPTPNPLQEKLQELEIAKIELEISKLQSEIQLNQARAQQAMADADKTSVEASNEASGLKHERNVQAQQAQAKANQKLEVTKSILKPTKQGEQPGDLQAAIGFNAISDTL